MNPENIMLSENKLDMKGQISHDSTDVRLSRPVKFTETNGEQWLLDDAGRGK